MFGISAATIGTIAAVGAPIIGGVIAANGAQDAANTQSDAAAADRAQQGAQFQQTRADQQPYRDLASQVALPGIKSFLANNNAPLTADQVTSEPGYQFGMDQGRNALEASAASRGGLYSGATARALERYGTDYGSTKYGDAFNRQQASLGNQFGRLATAAGIGQSATNQVAAAGQNYANGMSNALFNGANAQAAGSLAQGSAWGNALNRVSSYGNNWFSSPSSQGSQVSNGNLLQANFSGDPLGSLISQKGW